MSAPKFVHRIAIAASVIVDFPTDNADPTPDEMRAHIERVLPLDDTFGFSFKTDSGSLDGRVYVDTAVEPSLEN